MILTFTERQRLYPNQICFQLLVAMFDGLEFQGCALAVE